MTKYGTIITVPVTKNSLNDRGGNDDIRKKKPDQLANKSLVSHRSTSPNQNNVHTLVSHA